MKKSGIISIAVALALLLSACGAAGPAQSAAATPAPTLSAVSEESDDVELNLIQIGFSLQGEGAFHDQLAADIEAGCTALGYTYSLLTADSAERQITDITSFLSQGVSAIVIEPVDVDALESVLADCETDGVPVINIIDSIFDENFIRSFIILILTNFNELNFENYIEFIFDVCCHLKYLRKTFHRFVIVD